MTIFDVETSSLSDAELETVKPQFKAPSNYKDPLKVAAAIAEAEADWRASAALDAKTARILVIGLLQGTTFEFLIDDDEAEIVTEFWKVWNSGERMVGFNCKEFDASMIFQRSIILGIAPPLELFAGRYWNRFVDLQEIWNCYRRDTKGQSLDAVCRALKIGQKTGNGADFAKLFQTDLDAALEYLRNDLRLTAALAARLGVA